MCREGCKRSEAGRGIAGKPSVFHFPLSPSQSLSLPRLYLRCLIIHEQSQLLRLCSSIAKIAACDHPRCCLDIASGRKASSCSCSVIKACSGSSIPEACFFILSSVSESGASVQHGQSSNLQPPSLLPCVEGACLSVHARTQNPPVENAWFMVLVCAGQPAGDMQAACISAITYGSLKLSCALFCLDGSLVCFACYAGCGAWRRGPWIHIGAGHQGGSGQQHNGLQKPWSWTLILSQLGRHDITCEVENLLVRFEGVIVGGPANML